MFHSYLCSIEDFVSNTYSFLFYITSWEQFIIGSICIYAVYRSAIRDTDMSQILV